MVFGKKNSSNGDTMAKPPKTKKSKGKSAAAGDQWWDQASTVPDDAIVDAAKFEKSARWIRRLLWAIPVCVFIVVLSAATIFASLANQEDVDLTPPTDPTLESRTAANAAVTAWLASGTAIPGGEILGWEGGERFEASGAGAGSVSVYDIHTFEVYAGGVVYSVSVPVSVNGDALDVLATPAITATTPWAETLNGQTAQGEDTIAVDDNVESAITAWAEAYTSGDPVALRRAVADSDTSRYYVPLSGVSFTSVDVSQGFIVGGRQVDEEGNQLPPERVVVRVTAEAQWASLAPEEGEEDDVELSIVTYDVLIDRASSAAPVVVAWGAAGTGASLEPYENATSVEVESNDGSATDEDSSGTDTDESGDGSGAGTDGGSGRSSGQDSGEDSGEGSGEGSDGSGDGSDEGSD